MRKLIALGLCSFSLAFGSGCGSLLQDRCDAICECENCGEREREACEVEVEGDYQVADIYACTEQLEAYYECQLQEYSCSDRHYDDDAEGCRQCDRNHYAEKANRVDELLRASRLLRCEHITSKRGRLQA